MGNDGADANPGDGEGPERPVTLPAFEIGAATVTNAEFAAFVRATHHVTDAERLGSSFVFHLQLPSERRTPQPGALAVVGLPWWRQVEDACWQRPAGPGSQAQMRPDDPVVHVSWNDAQVFCAWAGCRLPSEAEWERAARGGLERRLYAWGDELQGADGQPRCNIFRGDFPDRPTEGWRPGPIDARHGEPNGFGLYNVCGNVWEWCADATRRPPTPAARRLVLVPRLVLQPLPGGGAQCQHLHRIGEQHRVSGVPRRGGREQRLIRG